MLRQDTGRFMLGKYMSDKKIPQAIECFLWPLVFQNTYQNIFKRSSKYVLKDLQNMYQNIFKMYIEIFSQISSKFLWICLLLFFAEFNL